uniref:Putative sonic hedgehog n=1 Tax=Lutzomyia longipalpis TaxID=7200 RepID=A0A1B0C973_LUTLO
MKNKEYKKLLSIPGLDSSQASYTSGCFTASSTVVTESGERRRLSDLRIGERVLSIDEDGRPAFSEVMLFLDRNSDEERQFVHIEADGNTHLSVTPSHLLMSVDSVGSRSFVFADSIEEGDLLLVAVNGTTLVPRRVLRVSVAVSRGVFAPLTRHGTVIVDSVAASCYALVESQSVAHWSFLPVRAATTISRWFSATKVPEASRQNGIHWYAKALYAIKDYVLPAKLLHH